MLDGLRLYLNDGSGSFANVSVARLGGAFGIRVALGDVDGDGDLDLVTTDGLRPDKLYLNNGGGHFSDATAGRLPAGYHQELVLGDVDEDGDLDLVLSRGGLGQNSFYLNDGTGAFATTAARMPMAVGYTRALALADVDGDDDLDLIVGNYVEPNLLYANLHRQLHTPYRAALGRQLRLDLYAQPGFAAQPQSAALVLGGGLLPTPVPVPPFGGAFAVDPAVHVILRPLSLPAPVGALSLTLNLPASPSLAGVTLATQAFVIHGPRSAAFSNAVVDVVGR